MVLEKYVSELERLQGDIPITVPGGVGTVRFIIRCPFGAPEVFDKAKSVLKIIDEVVAGGSWPSKKEWEEKLPNWFLVACVPEMQPEEAQKWLDWWQGLSHEEQESVEANKEWALLDWLYWMQPDNRLWFWWDAQCLNDADHIILAVEVASWPFPWGALRWLFKAAGCSAIVPAE